MSSSAPETAPRRRASAEQLLGSEHPLVGVLRTCGASLNAIAAVAAVQLGALPLWWTNVSYAEALAIAAATVQVVLVVRWAVFNSRGRDLCLELVVAGRGGLPLAPLARVRRRLANARRQRRLAATFEKLATAAGDRRLAGPRGICNRRVMEAVRPQLRGVAARLRTGNAGVRGVALLQLLIAHGTSPLYGDHSRPLRDELARARYLLAEA